MIGVAFQPGFGWIVLQAQPAGIVSTVMGNGIYRFSAYTWTGTAAAAALVAAGAAMTGAPRVIAAVSAAVMVFLNLAAAVMVRDGIGDVTLRAAGFEVWDRQVATNWSAVGVFLILFVAALAVVGYLFRVFANARRIEEKYA